MGAAAQNGREEKRGDTAHNERSHVLCSVDTLGCNMAVMESTTLDLAPR